MNYYTADQLPINTVSITSSHGQVAAAQTEKRYSTLGRWQTPSEIHFVKTQETFIYHSSITYRYYFYSAIICGFKVSREN